VSAGAGPSPHETHLAALGLPAAARTALGRYLDLLAAWNPRINLTGAATAGERVAVLVAPVAPLADMLARGRLVDVGSGNGSPGLVLAALRPDLEVTLLEPRQKRWAFLREAARAAGRPEVTVLRARHDAYGGPPAQTVTMRALGLALDALAPLVAPGGRLLVWGPPPAEAGPFRREADPGPGVRAWRRLPAAEVPRST